MCVRKKQLVRVVRQRRRRRRGVKKAPSKTSVPLARSTLATSPASLIAGFVDGVILAPKRTDLDVAVKIVFLDRFLKPAGSLMLREAVGERWCIDVDVGGVEFRGTLTTKKADLNMAVHLLDPPHFKSLVMQVAPLLTVGGTSKALIECSNFFDGHDELHDKLASQGLDGAIHIDHLVTYSTVDASKREACNKPYYKINADAVNSLYDEVKARAQQFIPVLHLVDEAA